MTASKTTGAADEAADAISDAAHQAGAKARQAATGAADALEDAADAGSRKIKSAARSGQRAYGDAARGADAGMASIEDAIRRNPLAAAGTALLVGVVLGRFIL